MFCDACVDFCNNFDLDVAKSEGGILHYVNYGEIVASADLRCGICIEIRRQRENKEPPGTYNDKYRAYGDQIRCLFDEHNMALVWIQGDLEIPYIAYMDVCTTADDPLACLIWTRPTHEDAWSSGVRTQISKWLERCRKEHSSCQDEENVLPTRLIDVGDADHEPFLFLSDGRLGKWLTLSYCWGQAVPVKTESVNLDERQKQIRTSELPPLFKDAIHFTRGLGYRYLWVDSLCIVQDSYNDWVNESANMGNIFKNSSLTIAAEASDNPNIGLYQGTSKSRRRLFRVSCHSEELNLKGSILVGRNNFGGRPFRGPLSSRAWTFQETILAHRVIRFAKGQIWWRCHEHECNERDPDAFCSRRRPNNTMWQVGNSNFLITKEASFFNIPSLQRQRRAFWYFLVEEFVSRKITYETDILPAISGLAKEVQRHFQYKYIAGLWLNTIHTDLLWHSPKKGAIRRNIYIAPSWSWASIDFSVSWKRTEHSDYVMFDLAAGTPIAEVVDVTVMNIKNDPFGQVESGRLQIRGPCREGLFTSLKIIITAVRLGSLLLEVGAYIITTFTTVASSSARNNLLFTLYLTSTGWCRGN
ncbi:hypothetical protein V495_00756 [Pseudogymnoascus sp. VKM F-4514 (FW-929)]|nr:hypothetical protein V495_00756 [Pseudogymnoascus sp. VKM F-4514 (FW-929)]